MNFASDNWAGADPRIVAAVASAAGGFAPAYGNDALTARVTEQFSNLFGREVAVFFVATGTAANALALSAWQRPGGAVLCHREAHIRTDEGGAPEFLGDLRLVGLEGEAAKFDAEELGRALARFTPGFVHHGQPVAVSISQLTEFGAAWRPDEIAAVAEVASTRGLALHMDGARFGNAVAGLGADPADLTWRAGVSVLSFGGTKGGCLGAEAVVFFDPAEAADFAYRRKRAGQLLSKSRFVAAQFEAYLRDGLWLELATHANAMAGRLAEGVRAAGGRLAAPADGNQLFAILPRAVLAALREAGASFYEWDAAALSEEGRPAEDEGLIRLVTSFASTADEVDRFVGIAAGGAR